MWTPDARIAFLPITPMLIPEIATGASHELDEVRSAGRSAVAWACSDADRIAVLVPHLDAPVPEEWSLHGFGLTVGEGPPVELPVAIARWFLQGRPAQVFDSRVPTGRLAACDALLVMGDGSASRSAKAPGGLDTAAVGFDDSVEAALLHGDAGSLADIDLGLAAEVGAAGAPAWQRLGLAVAEVRDSDVDVAQDPYGVLYLVARWTARWAGRV